MLKKRRWATHVEDIEVSCCLCKAKVSYENLAKNADANYCKACFSKHSKICKQCGEYAVDLIEGRCVSCCRENVYLEHFRNKQFFTKRVKRINGERKWLRGVSSVDLMSSFGKPDKEDGFDILVLYNCITDFNCTFDLIIVSALPEDGHSVLGESCTMSELKADPSEEIRRTLYTYLNGERCLRVGLNGDETLVIMPRAYVLKSMTYRDMNYGSNGNWYGDTSDFYIIGAIERKKPGSIRHGRKLRMGAFS